MTLFGSERGPVLVILPSWIGDIVMATPALRALAGVAHGQGLRVEALVRPGAAPLLAGLKSADGTPLLEHVIEVDARGLRGLVSAVRAARQRNAATAFLMPNSFRSALLAWLARIPSRLGYATDGRGVFLTVGIAARRARRPISTVDWYADLVASLTELPVIDRMPRLVVTDEERATANRLLDGVGRPFVLLNPGANRADKRWPAARFGSLAAQLRQVGDVDVVVTGGPSERELVAEVAAAGAGAIDLAARGVTLGSLKGVVEAAAVLVSNDTGPRHIAIGLGTPVVALFGPTDHRWTQIPGARERKLLAEPFLPGEQCADRHPKECAIERIPVSDALAAVTALLAESSSS